MHINKRYSQTETLTAVFLNIRSAVRIAHTGMTCEDVILNVMEAVQCIAKIIPRGWSNIQSLNIKSANSIALPIYTSLPNNIDVIEKNSQSKKRKTEDVKKRGKGTKKRRIKEVSS